MVTYQHSGRPRPHSGVRAVERAAQAREVSRPAAGRAVDAVDLHVGSRMRVARKAVNLTQEALAAQLGVTFQQLQKYEKGVNRISASRLHHAARVLGVPVAFFFPDADQGETEPAEGSAYSPDTLDSFSRVDGLELSRAFSEIADATVRRRVIELVRSIARSSG
jgi:transcriptional regulator with XRE-family HTH domain